MARLLVALVAGALFGGGLVVSQMTNPEKVLNFFDIFGNWDPSLMVVFVGALGTSLVGSTVILRRPAPILDAKFFVPTRRDIDPRLVIGAIVFGIGWGLSGLCPGPGVAALVTGMPLVIGFVAAMMVGMVLHRRVMKS